MGLGNSGVPGYALASLPTSGTPNAGRLARVTDDVRGLWMDTGTQWVGINTQVVNARDYGLAASGSAAANTTALTNALVGGNHVVIPPGTYSMNTFTLDQTETLEFRNGAIFSIPDGQQLVIAGCILAGDYQIFSSTVTPAGGAVPITNANIPVIFRNGAQTNRNFRISAAWWGAIGDSGTTDNSNALQQAFAACTNITSTQERQAARLYIPPGRYQFTRPLLIASDYGVATTQSLYGFVIEGAAGSKIDVGTSILTSAVMATQLRFTGVGASNGITIGDTTYRALGCLVKNLWFVAPTTALSAVSCVATTTSFEHCIFSNAGDSGTDAGLHLNGISCSIVSCSFNNCWNGLRLQNGTMCNVIGSVFQANRNDGIGASGLKHNINGCTFQDSVAKAIALDMQVYGTTGTSGCNISNCYLEGGTTTDNGILIRGDTASTTRAIGTVIRDNYFSSIGSGGSAYIYCIYTSETKIYGNTFPTYGSANEWNVRGAWDGDLSINIDIPFEGFIRDLTAAYGGTNPDLHDAAVLFTNRGAAGGVTFTLPRAISGLKYRFMKVASQIITVTASSTDVINGAASIASRAAGTGINADYLEITAIVGSSGGNGQWLVTQNIGPWA